MTDDANQSGRYTYRGIEKIIHEKSRLSILTSLYINSPGLSFNELKELCEMTDGNLSRHIQILKDAALISVKKSYLDNKPHTHCRMTKNGRERYHKYVKELETIVRETALAEKENARTGKARTDLSDEDPAFS